MGNPKTGPALPLDTRRCRKCGCEGFRAVDTEWSGSGHDIIFRCPQCGHKKKLTPLGGLGMMTAITALAIGIVLAFLLTMTWRDPLAEYFFGTLIVLWLGYLGFSWLNYWLYPKTGVRERDPQEIQTPAAPSDPLQKAITSVEGQTVWRGALTPIIVIVVVLGASTLLGLVNWYL